VTIVLLALIKIIRFFLGFYTLPKKCNDGCRSKSFSPLISSPYTLAIDWLCIRIQELTCDQEVSWSSAYDDTIINVFFVVIYGVT